MKVKGFKSTCRSTMILSISTLILDFYFEFLSSSTEVPTEEDQKVLQGEPPEQKMFENVYEEMQH